ncbi:MAG: hypothetical protein JSV90_08790 [Methanobacteriota archaeon]|nr:MAG: hypothetical protein JSV90_08790 [Euryarchaeota archaeon]
MAFRIGEHPMIFFVTFALPALLMFLGVIFEASAFLFILCTGWLGVAFLVLYLPQETDDTQ